MRFPKHPRRAPMESQNIRMDEIFNGNPIGLPGEFQAKLLVDCSKKKQKKLSKNIYLASLPCYRCCDLCSEFNSENCCKTFEAAHCHPSIRFYSCCCIARDIWKYDVSRIYGEIHHRNLPHQLRLIKLPKTPLPATASTTSATQLNTAAAAAAAQTNTLSIARTKIARCCMVSTAAVAVAMLSLPEC